MNNPKYNAFLKVAEMGSIKHAADLLGYTQTGMSYLINTLEEELDIKLFVRNYGGTVLTAEGKELLPFIKGICNMENRLYNKVNELKNLDSGRLTIGAPASVHINWLPGMIKMYSALHPGIDIEIKCCDDANLLEEMIYDGDIDCGFIIMPPKKKIETVELIDDPMVAILPMNHPLAKATFFPIDDLDKYPYIDTTVSTDFEVHAVFASHGKKANIAYRLDNEFSILSMVSQGFGFSLYPELLLTNVSFPFIKKRLEIPAFRTIAFAIRSKATSSTAALNFLDTAQIWLRLNEGRR